MLPTTELRTKIRIAQATPDDRAAIYRLRHEVYARELGQHPENAEAQLSDSLDSFNEYIVASLDGELIGFVSITPPHGGKFSIDKYLSRQELPFPSDDRLYEVRLLTVAAEHRRRPAGPLLMYAALRSIEDRGGDRVVAIGRREVLDLYRRVGLEPLGREIRSGAVQFELMTATTASLRSSLARLEPLLRSLEPGIDWQLRTPLHRPTGCYHGGAFWEGIGDGFEQLERHEQIINADVLDAWFPPAPGVLTALAKQLPFLLRTSPPAGCEGMVRAIAQARGVEPACLLAGAGSSHLIFQALLHWLGPWSRVLILDPTYGEYAHVLEQVIHCQVDRLQLSREQGYELDLAELEAALAREYDLVVLVNPNSPTGRHVPRAALERTLAKAPPKTRVWIDETYVEYAGCDQSLERWAAQRKNVIICKSMSKVYALSGVRAAYLCAAPELIDDLRSITPPWAVSLPGQVAVVHALQDLDYYAARYAETHILREELARELKGRLEWECVPGIANFVLCHLPAEGPIAAWFCKACRREGVYLRDASSMSLSLGSRALRIAVKDCPANSRIVDVLARVTSSLPPEDL